MTQNALPTVDVTVQVFHALKTATINTLLTRHLKGTAFKAF